MPKNFEQSNQHHLESAWEFSPDESSLMDARVEVSENASERLKNNPNLKDAEGLPRPLFSIAGRDVIFRNRQEMPMLEGRDIHVIGDIRPVQVQDMTDERHKQMRKYTANTSTANEHAVMVVTNTPEGIVEAAIELADDVELKKWLSEALSDMAAKKYNEPAARECVDYILSSIAINRDGADMSELDTDGFALALAALSGDELAVKDVEFRRTYLIENENQRRQKFAREHQALRERLDVEPLPLDRMALVHTTSHQLEYDQAGRVILRPAAQRRSDELPRSTLHFTINSRVDVHAEAQDAWKVGERMVVANLGRTVETNNGRIPEVLEGVDTYYSLNPGEGLVLDGATVVESVESLGDDDVMRVTDNTISYVLKHPDRYSEKEERSIRELALPFGLSEQSLSGYDTLLQEVALRKALQLQNIDNKDMDLPSIGGHGMRRSDLADRVHAAAFELGITVGTHFNQPHSAAEQEAYSGMSGAYTGKLPARFIEPRGVSNHVGAGLAMRRQQLVSGYMPARPLAYEPRDLPSLDFTF